MQFYYGHHFIENITAHVQAHFNFQPWAKIWMQLHEVLLLSISWSAQAETLFM